MQVDRATHVHVHTRTPLPPPPLQLSRDFAHFVPRGASKPAICMQHASMRTRTAPISPRYPPFSSTTYDCGLTHMGNTCCHSHKPSTQRTTIPVRAPDYFWFFFSSKEKDAGYRFFDRWDERSNYRRGKWQERLLFYLNAFRFASSNPSIFAI